VPMRDRCPAPLAAGRSSTQPRHLRRGAGFVDEDQTVGIEVWLCVEPDFAGSLYVGTLLFARMRRLFLYVTP
jgi:hypothetical protein